MSRYTVVVGDCRVALAAMEAGSVHCCVTSPPYWGLRDYGHDGQLGLERTPDEYVARMVEVFRDVRRVLRDDGVVFLNLGDSYFGGGRGGGGSFDSERPGWRAIPCDTSGKAPEDYPKRDCLCGSLCGACLRAYRIGRSHSDSLHVPTLGALPNESIRAHMESLRGHLPTLDCVGPPDHTEVAMSDHSPLVAREHAQLRASAESTFSESSLLQRDGSRLSDTPSACLLCGCSLYAGALGFA